MNINFIKSVNENNCSYDIVFNGSYVNCFKV